MSTRFQSLFGPATAPKASSRFDELFGGPTKAAQEAHAATVRSAENFAPRPQSFLDEASPLADVYGAPKPPGPGATPEEIAAFRLARLSSDIEQRGRGRRLDVIQGENAASAALYDKEQAERDRQATLAAAQENQKLASGGWGAAVRGEQQKAADAADRAAHPDADAWGERIRKSVHRNWGGFEQQLAGVERWGMEHLTDIASVATPGLAPALKAAKPLVDQAVAPVVRATEAAHKAAQADIEANAYKLSGKTDEYIMGMADSLVQMVPTVAAAYLTRGGSLEAEAEMGGTGLIARFLQRLEGSASGRVVKMFGRELRDNAPGLGVMAVQMGGQKYGESRAAGRTVGQSDVDGLVFGLAEAIPEALPLGMIMKPGGKFLPRLLKTAGMEGGSEVITQAIEDGYSVGVLNEKMTWAEARQNLIDAGIIGFGMGAGMHAGAHAVHKARGGDEGAAIREMRDTPFTPIDPEAVTGAFNPNPGVKPRPIGIRQRAESEAPPLTPEDHASPIQTDLIEAGRRIMAGAAASSEADELLAQHGAPPIGTRVRVNFGHKTVEGIVEDGFVTTDPQAGSAPGIKITMADGSTFDEHFATIQRSGITIEPISAAELAPAAPDGREASPAPVRATPRPARSQAPAGGGMAEYLALAKQAESGGEASAENPRSTASGTYQFLDGTFRQYYRKVYGTDPGEHPSAALKHDPEVQQKLMDAFTADNAHRLQQAGVPVNPSTLYAAHHFGSGGAIAMGRNPDALVDPKVVSQNPQFRGMTNQQALAWADAHLRGSRAPGQPGMTATDDQATDFSNTFSTDPSDSNFTDAAKSEAAAAAIKPATEPTSRPIEEAAKAERTFPTLDDKAAPSDAARRLAADLLEAGFGNTNGMGHGYRFATDQTGILMPGHQRPAKNSVTVEIDTAGGREVFSFPKSQLARDIEGRTAAPTTTIAPVDVASLPAAEQPSAAPVPPFPTLTPTASGKGIIISGAAPEHIAAIRAALPASASLAPTNNGAFTVSKKYEMAVNLALASTVEPISVPESAPAPAPPATPAATGGLQTDLLGGPAVSAYELDARREAPKLIEFARAEDSLPSLADAARYVLNPENIAGDRDQSTRELSAEVGRTFDNHDEASAFARAILAQIEPQALPETPGPVTGGAPANEFSPAGANPSAPFRAPEPTAPAQPSPPAYEPAGPVADRPTEMDKQEQLKTWVSKEFKAHLKQVPGDPPHRESPVAAATMRGWVEGKANDLPQLRREGREAMQTAATITNAENGFNPRQGYLEAFYAARTGKHVEIRAKGGGRVLGAAQVLAELDPSPATRGPAPITVPQIQDLGRDDGRYAVDTGAVLTTRTGRKTSPAPAFNQGTPAHRTKALKAQEKWLLDEAIAEARASQPNSASRHALPSLERMQPGNMSPSDHDLLNEVLFGDPNGPEQMRPYRGPPIVPPQAEPTRAPAPTTPDRSEAAPATAPDTSTAPAKDYGTTNKGFTEDAYAAAKKRMQDRMNRANSGIDPEMMMDGIVMAGFHIEAGARKFAAYAKAMIIDLGPKIIPNLRSFYEAVRYDPRAAEWASDMSGPEEIGAALARLEDQQKSDNIPSEEQDNAGTPKRARANADDRGRDEGAGPGNLPGAEGQRDAEPKPEVESAGGAPDLRPDVQRGRAGSEQPEAEPASDGSGERGDAGAKPGRRGGNRAGRRVRRTDASRGVNYLAPKGSLTRQGGWKATAERNLDIIELVNKLDAEARPATAEEQALLAKFTGWGAGEIRNNLLSKAERDPETGERRIPEAFWGDWKDLINRARRLLTGANLETALQTTQYAHYTSEPVIRSMWNAMERFGFKGGRILEPGMGIGLFATAAPADIMEASSYTGIELDGFSAKIAQYLLPQETALHNDFTKQKLPDGFFDVAIGNPPFSATKILDDPAYKKHRLSLHDYFFAKSIDKVRPGGLMVFVTSRYTMDKLNDKGRAYIADRADLIGAIRLPQTAFKDNAGTEVVTDVLFFQRRMPGAEPGGEAWRGTEPLTIEREGVKATYPINEYFARHPEMVLGTPSSAGSMYGKNEYTVIPREGDIADHFAKAVEALPKDIYSEPVEQAAAVAKAKAWEADMRPAAEKEGGLYLKDGEVFIRDQGVGKPARAIDEKLKPADEAWLKSYVDVRDALKAAQQDQLNEGPWETSLKALNKAYTAFVKQHGPIQATTVTERKNVDEDGNETIVTYRRLKNQRLLDLDVESPLVFGLEKVADDGTVTKGQFLQGRTLNKPTRPKIESVDDALAVSLDEIGRLDLDYIASIMKMDREAVIDTLGDAIFHSPSGVWLTRDEYLSGDVLTKLEEAKAAADVDPVYERNVTALQAVQPPPLGPKDISIKLGAGWIPVEMVKTFASDVLGVDAKTLTYEPATAEWSMEMSGSRVSRSAAEEFGTEHRSPHELLVKVLNNETIKVQFKDSKGTPVTDATATAAAVEAASKMVDRFKTWAWEDAKRASALLEIYNRKFNNLAPRRFDGAHLTFPGLSAKYKLFDHQKRAVWRQIQTGNVYLAHAVGAGKTLEMIVGGMEQKRLGLIRKPMYVVPNHMLNQFAREFMEAYPAASIMVADEKAFHTDNRKRFMAQAALNDPDAIIITHSSFSKLGTKQESREAVVSKMVEELEAALEGADTKYTRSKIEAQIESLKRAFEGRVGNASRDQALTFEEMGVDYVYVDEAHLFRKLDYATNRTVKGIDPKGSARALDLYIKTRWLETQRPGRSLTLASGTPVTNTMAEIYSVMRYMAEPELERDGLRAFDAWANMFGEVASGYEQNASGGYEIVERFAKFVNVPELMKRVRTFMDVLTSDSLGDLVQRPKVITGSPQSIVSPPIATLKVYMDGELKQRIVRTRAWKPSKAEPQNPDPIIAINGDARLASIDMRFIDPRLPNDPGSKLNVMIDRIIAKHHDIKGIQFVNPSTGQKEPGRGGTQIVFSAVGFGEGAMINRGFDLRAHLDGRLMKEGGLKKSEIAWMSDANTHAKKEALFKDMRAGRVKVLVGSPGNMGTGVNVQNRLRALHFLSPPWYPADVEQPQGRIIRQGNWNPEVDLFWYATKGTYDSTAWNMVSRKARFIEQAMSGDDSVRSLEDISEANQYEMAAAMAAGDERIIQIVGFTSDIERLSRLQTAHAEEQISLAHDERWAKRGLDRAKAEVASVEAAIKARDPDAPFSVEVEGETFDKQGEAGKAVIAKIVKEVSARVGIPTLKIGTYQGKHEIGIEPASEKDTSGFIITVKVGGRTIDISKPIPTNLKDGKREFDSEDMDPVGMGSRIQNAIARLPAELRAAQQDQTAAELELSKIARKLGAPFAQAQDLAEKIAERANLQATLAAETAAQDAADKAAAGKAPAPVAPAPAEAHKPGDAQAETSTPLRGDPRAVSDRRGTVRGFGIAAEIQRTGSAALVGRTVEGADALAEIAQVYRDPRYETFRMFFTKGDTLVHATGVSSRFTAAAPLMPGKSSIKDLAAWAKEIMERTGADGYFMLHNHPSGEPKPSSDDIAVTRGIIAVLPGFRGHVVINSNKFAIIQANGTYEVKARDFGEDRLLTPSIPHPSIGKLIRTGDDLAELAKNLQQPGFVTLIAADARGKVRAIVDYAETALNAPDAILMASLRAVMRRSGSARLFLVGRNKVVNGAKVREAIKNNIITEALDENQSPIARGLATGGISPLERTDGNFVADAPGAVREHGVEFEPATEERFQSAKSGLGDGPGLIEKSQGWWHDLATGFTRHWKALPNEPRFADIQQQFRKLEAAPEAAVEETVRRLTGLVKGFNRNDLDLFTRKVVLDDLQWEASVDHKLPFGFTPQTLAVARAQVDEAVAANETVASAVRRRKLVNNQLADEMVAAGVLTAEQIRNPAYYRHMVLEFARAEMKNAHAPGSKIKSPYWAKRMGSDLDINANLLEAEFDWMQKALVDIATARTIEWVKKSNHNIREKLKAQATASNKALIDALVKADTQPDGTRGPIANADLYFRQLIARGMAEVRKEILDGNLDPIPAHLQGAADALAADRKGEPPFALMSWIMDNEKDGMMGAAMVLKGVGQRKSWARDLLGDKYHDPEDIKGLVKAFAPPGFSAWQPIEGQHLFTAKTISESALDMFVGKLADTAYPGIDRNELARALGTIRSQLVVGGDRYTMVLPDEIVETLNEFGDRRARGMVSQLFGGIQGAWKRWMLINPRRVIKYNINNFTGDADAMIAGNPGAFLKVKQAATELYAVMKNGAKPSQTYQDAVERGVFTSGLSVQEIPDINRLSALRHLTDQSNRPDRLVIQAAGSVWRALQGATQWRENVFRYAAYLDYVQKIESGMPQIKIGYGASVPAMVDAVEDPKDKAALLARDLLGDYGSISTAGAWLRRYMIPFWSWQEINTKRYWRLTSNAYTQSKAKGLATGGLLGAGVAVRVGAGMAIRMAFLYGLLYLWNNLLHGEDEDKLSDQQRRQMHLILGHNSDGEVMTLRTQGALSDVLGFLGFPDAIAGIKKYEEGQGTIGQAIADTLKAPVNRIGTSVSPLFSVPLLELPSGEERWPDMFNPRPIHDKARHVAKAVNLENEYDLIADRPSRGYANSWFQSVIYKRDPGEMAYDEAKGIAYDWLERVKGESGGARVTPRGEALRDYRMALRYGDKEAADAALAEFDRWEGTAKGLKASIKRQDPLGPIAKKDRRAFVQSLTDEQYETFLEADAYYRHTYKGEPLAN